MSIGRRKVSLTDDAAWVFNRMVDAYEARPAYPAELIAAVTALAPQRGARVLDVGAGIGHLSLPLAQQDCDVTAVEPAREMLERLTVRAAGTTKRVCAVHGAAESLPLPDASFDLVLVADAVHFLDSERASREVDRVRAPGGAVAVVQCDNARTPFMDALVEIMEDAAPRRPRDVSNATTEILAVSGVRAPQVKVFHQHTPVDESRLEQILKSISFIGPAMNEARWSAFIERVHAIRETPVWSRICTLRYGQGRT